MPRTVLLIVALLSLALAPVLAADEAKEQIKEFESAMKSADKETRVKLLQDLAKSGNAGAAKAISKFMQHRDDEVAVAALTAIGELKEKKYLGRLIGMVKPMKDRPAVLAAVARAIGAYGERKGMDTLVDIGKKWLAKNSSVASAAAEGLGRIPHKTSVDELIALLDLTYPKASANGPSISTQTRDLLAESRPAIMKGLSNLTGWDFAEPRAWQNFWDKMAKSWKPGVKEIKWADLKGWEDPGYRFKIEKPDPRWEIQRGEGVRIQMSFVELNSDEQRITQASVWIVAYDLTNFANVTAAQKAEDKEEWYRNNWKDTKEETWVRDPKFRVGREQGNMIAFTGQDSSGNILKVKNVYMVNDGFMYEIGTWMRSGVKPFIPEQIDKAIQSFRFTR